MHYRRLLVIQTHPIQYWAPIYRQLNQATNFETLVIYGSDFSCNGYHDQEFQSTFSWDVDLLSGYQSFFLTSIKTHPHINNITKLTTKNLHKTISKLYPDAILLTGYHPKFNMLSALISSRLNIPLIIRSETNDTSHDRSKLKNCIRSCILRYAYTKISRFCYIGTESKNHYRRLGVPDKKLHFSPYCIPAGLLTATLKHSWRSKIRKSLQIPKNRVVLIFSGKMIRKKSPDHILLSAKYLPNNILDNLSVIFIGNGEMLPALKSMPENKLFASVHYLGFVNQSSIGEYYAASDLLSLNSLFKETWGLVVNEALSVGIPCVVSDKVGCRADLIQDGVTGHTHKAGNLKSLAQAIVNTIFLSKSDETARSCQSLISSYSTQRAVNGIADAFNSLFDQKDHRDESRTT